MSLSIDVVWLVCACTIASRRFSPFSRRQGPVTENVGRRHVAARATNPLSLKSRVALGGGVLRFVVSAGGAALLSL
jgi:hypothetical protein